MKQFEIIGDYDNVDWQKVIKVLMAYAYVLIGDQNEKMNNSRADLAYDFTMETITKYLQNKSKFKPSRNPDLVKYLKYNYLRQIISNSKKTGNFRYENTNENNEEKSYLSEKTFLAEYNLDEKIDTDLIINNIEKKLLLDKKLLQLFKCKYHYNQKRSEICDELNITKKEYDNRIKRLQRIVTKAMKDKVNNA